MTPVAIVGGRLIGTGLMFKALWKALRAWLGFVEGEETPGARRLPATVPPAVPSARPAPGAGTPATRPAQPPAPKLYEGKRFSIGDAERAAADQFLLKNGRPGPTTSQRQVLFSDATATTVLAGAGSGKSTTLVQRVLFMRKVLKIDFSTMAVFTFTRKSRQDFIRKLLEEAPLWGVALSEKQAQQLVRTFHSKALSLAKGILGKGEQIFEFLGEEKPKDAVVAAPGQGEAQGEELSEAERLANEADGFLELKANEAQAAILREAYAACYAASDRFRAAILRLFSYTLASRSSAKPDPKFEALIRKLEWMSAYDSALSEQVEGAWRQGGSWPVQGVAERVPGDERFALQVMGHKFWSNGYIERLGIHVVLGPADGVEQAGPMLARHKVRHPLAAIANKRRALLVGCDSPIRFVQTAEDLRQLRLQLAVLDSEHGLSAPALKLRLPGETEKPAFEALYAFGVFVETVGLQPDKLNAILGAEAWSPVEKAVIDGVSEFFAEFHARLGARGLVTFNQVFSRLGEHSPDLEKLGVSSLIGVKHLLIDEFQDISPLIVRFVRGVQKELLRKSGGTQQPSLMCVGDDWQSIYGWRGSSPHFLLQLAEHFPGASPVPLRMEENFRSSQKIINCGEAFISQVQVKSRKSGRACHPAVKALPYAVGAIEKYCAADVAAAVTEILGLADESARVYVLAATHKDLGPYKAIRDSRLTCTTFHQSKGLEADYVILVGAPRHFGANDLKNGLYRAAKFPQRFDDAQRDEAFRVAYVAATRARRLCLWFAERKTGSVIEAVPADGICRLPLAEGAVLPYIRECLGGAHA